MREKIVFMILSAALCSCTVNLVPIKNEAKRLADHINQLSETKRTNTLIRKEIVENAYENMDSYDLSTDKVDISDGGDYTWFEDYLYYTPEDKFSGDFMINVLSNKLNGLYWDPEIEYSPENIGIEIKLTPRSPEMEYVKRMIRLWEHIGYEVLNAGEQVDHSKFVYWCDPRIWMQYFSMYFDYVSTMNPKWTHTAFMQTQWIKDGSPHWNTSGESKWTENAFTGMAGEGWILANTVPMYAAGEWIGLMNVNLYIMEISEKEFSNNEMRVAFLGANTALLGVSKSAKDLLSVNELSKFDYVEQMENNTFVQSEYLLTDPGQKPYTQEIGRKVLEGLKEFSVNIEGSSYTVVVNDIPEIGFYVIGLVQN